MNQEERLKSYFPIGAKVIHDGWLYTVTGYEKKYKYWRILVESDFGADSITERGTSRAEAKYPRGLKFYHNGYKSVVLSDDGENVRAMTVSGEVTLKRSEL